MLLFTEIVVCRAELSVVVEECESGSVIGGGRNVRDVLKVRIGGSVSLWSFNLPAYLSTSVRRSVCVFVALSAHCLSSSSATSRRCCGMEEVVDS